MKLSEILKDFPKKHKCGRGKRCYLCDEYEPCSHNNLINACDREIDREALMDALSGTRMFTYEEFAERIISTMPQWLKRIENGKISS